VSSGSIFWGFVYGDDEILLDLVHSIGIDSRYDTGVLNAQQDRPSSVPIYKCTDRLIDIPVELSPARLEFCRQPFTPLDQLPELLFVHL
jgi:hypothetical protein